MRMICELLSLSSSCTYPLFLSRVIQINRPLIILTILEAACTHAALNARYCCSVRGMLPKAGEERKDSSRPTHNSRRLEWERVGC